MGSKLSLYLEDVATILRDQGYSFTTQAQLTRYVNEARRQCAQRTGCVLRLLSGQSAFGASAQPGQFIPGGAQPGAIPGAVGAATNNASSNTFRTMPGVERYSYQGFANSYLKAQHQGCESIIDVMCVSINWGGGVNGSPRPNLAWMPWDDLQAYARAYSLPVTSYPSIFSVMNDGENGEVWIFPQPSQALEMEWVVYASPSALHTDDDYDAIPSGFTNSIKFLAASLAFMSSGRYLQMAIMDEKFYERIGSSSSSRDRGKAPNYYFGPFS